jgi:hypothetical protein
MKKILKNRFVAASLLFLLVDLAGAFALLAPFLVMIRNKLDRSSLALRLWPLISPDVIADIFINEPQIIAMQVVAASVIFILFMLLKTLFTGGIYHIIINRPESGDNTEPGFFGAFLARSARYWPGFVKAAVLAIPIYLVAGFLGLIFARLVMGLATFAGVLLFFFFMLLASTYLQLIRAGMIASDDNSIVNSVRFSRQAIARNFLRILAGNISVCVAGFIPAYLLWLALGGVRRFDWNPFVAAASIILQQLIVLVVCFTQSLRINFNYSILARGVDDALGRTQLDRV